MRKILITSAILMALFPILAKGQTQKVKNQKFIKVNYEFGGLIGDDEQIVQGSYHATEIKLGWQTTSDQKNESFQVFRFPSYGIGFYTGDLSAHQVGYPNALFGWVNIPIVRKPRSSFNYELGLGLSYNFDPHDPDSNPVNLIIGSYRNVYINLGFDYNYILSDRIDLSAGIGYKHFSNGAYKLPNKGVNLVALQLGLKYKFQKHPAKFEQRELSPLETKYNLYFWVGSGSKQVVKNGPRYSMNTFAIGAQRTLGRKHKIGLGTDIFYAGYYKDVDGINIIATGDNPEKQLGGSDAIQLALFLSGEMIIDKLSVFYGAGVYVHKKVESSDSAPYYLRAQARYTFYKNFYGGVAIKAHGGRADYVEYSLGYNFNL
ncbi:acyloxyacyl hydrolase [Aureibacter tunicatorum]|uniref:Lipid A 3-O-deacylase PagL n=1 Tax=Aureibacter tunicatorum TaxID=866807 RepID=A0AAE3XT90_9BACT|nr:acyloxyacyl hydrolase [Aureibacter tunicatorum]MDR6241589.1 hypothetical protein [Aureibacter tunicatorum]BDD07187.1 hypothetical protein AUTU_46700 [Aureibacter tunicatorum]